MKAKSVLDKVIATLVCVLLVVSAVTASTPVVVTNENLVLKDASGNVIGIVGLNTTILYCTAIDQLTSGQGVKLYRLVVENGSSFPSSPLDKQLFYLTTTDLLYIYDSSVWNPVGAAPTTYPYANITGVPDLSSLLAQNGSRPLLNNWNTGSYGIYGLTYVSTVGTVYCAGLSNVTLAGYVNTTRLLVETAATAPATPASGYVYFDTAQNNLFIYNGTGWMALGNASSPAAPDLTVYLFDNGTRPLTANWNTGSYGLYGMTWVNTTSLNIASQLWWNGYNRTDIIAHPQDSFNFLVYSEGGVTFARTGNTWQVMPSTIQACVDAVTASGGSIIVKNGTYSEAVSLKNATRLVLDRGCVGVTVTIASGATAILEDYNAAITWVWSGGVLVMQYNNINGLITGIYANFNQYWNGAYNRTDAVVNPYAPYSYIIDLSGTTYRMRNGTTGQVDYQSTNLTLVEQFANGNLTSGLIYLKEVLWNTSLGMPGDNVMVIQSCLGELKYISAAAKFVIPQLVSDPNTTGWTQAEQGRMWFNTAGDVMKYWNGSAIVVFPSIGGGSSLSYTLPYSYTIYVSGSTYYAEKSDGTTFSGTNAWQIMNCAIGNMTSGQTLFVKSGNYSIGYPIAWSEKAISIIGEGSTSGSNAPNKRGTAFIVDKTTIGSHYVFEIGASSVHTGGVHLANFVVVGQGAAYTEGKGGISLTNVGESLFENVASEMWNYDYQAGWFLSGDGTGASTRCNTFVDCGSEFDWYGWVLADVVHANTWIGGTNSFGAWGASNSYGLYVNSSMTTGGGDLDTNKFYNVNFEYYGGTGGSTGCAGVYLVDGGISCEFYGCRFEANTLDVYIGVGASDILFVGGNIVNATEVGKADWVKVYNMTTNERFSRDHLVIENWVSSANTTATTFVFNHGLSDTPEFVQCSFNFTGWTSWSWTATSTQVTITVTGTLPAAMTCYCEAKYTP